MKFVILFHLFGGNVRRFSELRRAIPAVSEQMLIQQLRQIERDGIVRRFVHHQVPHKVEYSLTDWGQALCPALDALLKWVDLKETLTEAPLIALDKVIAPVKRAERLVAPHAKQLKEEWAKIHGND